MQNDQQFDPAQYVADNSQMEAFRAGIESQQEIGREAAERHQKAISELDEHMALVRRSVMQPHSLDPSNPKHAELLRLRRGALGSALRRIQA